jgi:hypothetical protein
MNFERPAIPVEPMYRERKIHPESLLDLVEGVSKKNSNQDEFGATEQLANNISGELKCAICLELFAKPVTLNAWYETNLFILFILGCCCAY